MQPLTLGLVLANPKLAEDLHASLRDLPVRILMEEPQVGDWAAFEERLGRLRPDVLILEITGHHDHGGEVIRKIRATAGSPAVVAVHSSAEPEIILQAMRAGAVEYLSPPFQPSMSEALERISSERAPQQAGNRLRARTLAFFSAKGGCGATTIACHVAAELGRKVKGKVLLGDFDLDSGLVHFLMKAKSEYTVLDAVHNIHRLDPNFWKALVTNGRPGLDIVSAPPGMASRRTTDAEGLPHVLRFVRTCYDWAVIDLGRGLNHSVMRLLEEVDESYLVATLDIEALFQAKNIAKTLQDAGYGSRLRLVVNRLAKRNAATTEEIREMVGIPPFAALPEDHAALYEAVADGTLLPPGVPLAAHLAGLARKISGISEEKPRKKFLFLG
ncbi:MAG TPA: hypothetical protein VFA33_08550 [Bryobacteraceae bacterium]|nr:hypothetical protein [Bryobacteraceae bacterium]